MKLSRSAREVLEMIDAQGWFDYYANLEDCSLQHFADECRACDLTPEEMRKQIELAKQCSLANGELKLVPCLLADDILDHIEMKLEDMFANLNAAQIRAAKQILRWSHRDS